jgi:hypothetical protein
MGGKPPRQGPATIAGDDRRNEVGAGAGDDAGIAPASTGV